jgi:hypothetical protein
MQSSPFDRDRLARMVQDWLLASLRFAVTQGHVDQLVLLAAASELDRQGMATSCFNFFQRTSVRLCQVIVDRSDTLRVEVLQQHLARIPDERLRSAFAAAVCVDLPVAAKPRERRKKTLWEGLAPRSAERGPSIAPLQSPGRAA